MSNTRRNILKFDISKQLDRFMSAKGICIDRLAARAEISKKNLTDYHTAAKLATRRSIRKIAFVLGMTHVEFLGYDPGFGKEPEDFVLKFSAPVGYEGALRILNKSGNDYLNQDSDFSLYAPRERTWPIKNSKGRWVL
jgi:hypothetical protein